MQEELIQTAPEKKIIRSANVLGPSQESWVGRIPKVKEGTYSDGLPLDDITYLAFKLILKPNRFISRSSMFEFAKAIKKPAEVHGVGFRMKEFVDMPIKIREVLFVDTQFVLDRSNLNLEVQKTKNYESKRIVNYRGINFEKDRRDRG